MGINCRQRTVGAFIAAAGHPSRRLSIQPGGCAAPRGASYTLAMSTLKHPTVWNRTLLRRSWDSWFSNDLRAVGPRWLQLVWTLLFCMLVAVPFTVFGFAAFAKGDGAWRNLEGWVQWYGINLQVSLVIGFICHFLFFATGRLLGGERIRHFGGWQRTLYFTSVPLVGTAIGWPLGAWVAGYRLISWRVLNDSNALAATVLIALVITVIFHFLFAAKARQLEAEKKAAEAQLRLLQGQIEPHFLFNTLANVISLIDHDAPKARQMLESFTDYLRSSLTSLRHEQATLGSELDLVQNYLGLLKTRMEDRLRFSIASDEGLRETPLPPLLLQPLVENAIHHGLEPKVDGGHVGVRAWRDGEQLVVTVTDDGLGLAAPPRRKGGAGMALANLRERLQAQYGDAASLSLAEAQAGTVATLRLPVQPTAQKAPA
jgi:signal transduction histidine kinase